MLLGRSVPGGKRLCSLLPLCSVNPSHSLTRSLLTTQRCNKTYQSNESGNRERRFNPRPVCYCSFAAAATLVTASGSLREEKEEGEEQPETPIITEPSDDAPKLDGDLELKLDSEPVPTPGVDDPAPNPASDPVSTLESDPEPTSTMDPLPPPQVMRYLDDLYVKEEFQDLAMSLARYSELNNDEMLWRRARAEWEVIKLLGSSGGKDAVVRLKDALDLLDRALELNERNSNAHRWKGIISNGYTERLGMKEQFGNLPTFKYHLERALELDPNDGTVCTLLGIWHMELQELSWIQRKFAATFLGSVPATSYEEALHFFLMAEEVAPRAWVRNLFLIAKAYLALGDRANAKKYLELTLEQTPTIQDDNLIQEEAGKLYKKHFVVLM